MARSVMQTELGSAGNSWAYVAVGGGRVQSVLLTTALFHHIYYSYVSWENSLHFSLKG